MITQFEQSRPRSKQTNIGPSELGTECLRQLAYKQRGAPKTPNQSVPWAPFQGSAIHDRMADVLEYWNETLGYRRFIIENRVYASERVNGRGDAYDVDQRTVIDWKYVGLSTLTKLGEQGSLSPLYKTQTQTYARGYELVGYDVRSVLVVLLARDSRFSQSLEWAAPYDRSVSLEAIARERTLSRMRESSIVSIPASPGSECRWCDYYIPSVATDEQGCQGGSSLGQPTSASLLKGKR